LVQCIVVGAVFVGICAALILAGLFLAARETDGSAYLAVDEAEPSPIR
jgi:hypothetical protein